MQNIAPAGRFRYDVFIVESNNGQRGLGSKSFWYVLGISSILTTLFLTSGFNLILPIGGFIACTVPPFYFAKKYGSKNSFLSIGYVTLFLDILFLLFLFLASSSSDPNESLAWSLGIVYLYGAFFLCIISSIFAYFFWPAHLEPNISADTNKKIGRLSYIVLFVAFVFPLTYLAISLLVEILF
ncbi:MAG: hypothetical protein AAB552_03785 [Patescibacteria group bacterium]